MVAQESNLKIFGISYGSGVRTSDTRTELTGTFSEDGRHAKFSLTVSVRNYGSKPARYKLQVQMERGARSDILGDFDVAAGAVRRNENYFTIDFAGVGGPFSIPLPEPVTQARAEVVLLNQEGRVLDRRPVQVVLRFPRKRTDLRLEDVRIDFAPFRVEGGVGILPMTGQATIRNVGTDTWGFNATVMFRLQRGTPETELNDIRGERGRPILEQVRLPGGIATGETRRVSAELRKWTAVNYPTERRVIAGGPQLESSIWYTLTVATSSEADLDLSNDSMQLVFMLNDRRTIQETRTIRVTNRVRVVER